MTRRTNGRPLILHHNWRHWASLGILLLLNCSKGSLGLIPVECNETLSCSPGLECHTELGRCTSEQSGVESYRVHLQWQVEGVPGLYTEQWSKDDLAEQNVVRTVPQSVLVHGRVHEILSNDQISSSLLPSNIDISPVQEGAPVLPHLSLKSLGGAGKSGDGFQVWLSPDVPHLFQVHPNQIELPVARQLVTLNAGSEQVVEVIVQGLSKLIPVQTRLVRPDDSPVPSTWCHLEDAGGTPATGVAISQEDGSVTLYLRSDALAPFTLVASGLDNVPGGSFHHTLETGPFEGDLTVGVDLGDTVLPIETPGLLRINVLNAESSEGAPVGTSFVSAIRISPGIVQVLETVSDNTGTAVFESLQPGLFLVTALPHPDLPFRMATQAIWVQPGAQTTATITCGKRTEVFGIVRNGSGQILAGFRVFDTAPVALAPLGTLEILRATSDTTNSAGRYSFQAGAGTHHLLIRPKLPWLTPPTAFTTEISNDTGDEQIELDLEASLPFVRRVTFLDASGDPFVGAQVTINWDDDDAPDGYLQVFATTDDTGSVVLALPGTSTQP